MENIYNSVRWRELRQKVLRRDGYQCQMFKRYGKTRPANTVHHVFPVEDFPEYRWEAWNLISVSHQAHEALHDRATGNLTKEGIELLKRTARKNGIEVPAQFK